MRKILILITFFFLWSTAVSAATLSFESEKNSLQAGDQFSVIVDLDTDKESINSFEFKIGFSKESLHFVGYNTQNSITNFWIVPPKLEGDVIFMSGMIPGGVSTTYNPKNLEPGSLSLVELVFEATNSGQGKIFFVESEVLKNDGLGSKLAHQTIDNLYTILPSTNKVDKKNTTDTNPPVDFEIDVIPASKEANTPMLIAFNTIDAEGGIAEYKILQKGKWVRVESPYPVKQGIFNKQMIVRAYDFAGNVAESSVVIPAKYNYLIYIIILTACLAGFYLRKLLK